MANVALTLDMTILGAPTQVSYQYLKVNEKGGSCFLVAPQKLISGTKMSIAQLIKDFETIWKKLSGKDKLPGGMPKTDDITAQLDGLNATDQKNENIADQIEIQIKTIYLYIDTRGEKSVFEYALCCQVEQSVIPQSIKAFNITSLNFALWDTQNQKILDMMGIVDPSKVAEVKALEPDKNAESAPE